MRLVFALVLALSGCSVARYSSIKPCRNKPMVADMAIALTALIPMTYGLATERYKLGLGSFGVFLAFSTSAIIGTVKIMPPPGYRRVCP